MENVTFYMLNCLILDVRTGTTAPDKGARPYAVLNFLCQTTLQVYECFCFGDACSVALGLTRQSVLDLIFEVTPVRGRAGFRVDLCGVAQAGTAGLVMDARDSLVVE